jgi:hypothetical protein
MQQAGLLGIAGASPSERRGNAAHGGTAYWYRRAKKPVCRSSLDEEWQAIAEALLKARGAGGA